VGNNPGKKVCQEHFWDKNSLQKRFVAHTWEGTRGDRQWREFYSPDGFTYGMGWKNGENQDEAMVSRTRWRIDADQYCQYKDPADNCNYRRIVEFSDKHCSKLKEQQIWTWDIKTKQQVSRISAIKSGDKFGLKASYQMKISSSAGINEASENKCRDEVWDARKLAGKFVGYSWQGIKNGHRWREYYAENGICYSFGLRDGENPDVAPVAISRWLLVGNQFCQYKNSSNNCRYRKVATIGGEHCSDRDQTWTRDAVSDRKWSLIEQIFPGDHFGLKSRSGRATQ